jgi:hypothetical protein
VRGQQSAGAACDELGFGSGGEETRCQLTIDMPQVMSVTAYQARPSPLNNECRLAQTQVAKITGNDGKEQAKHKR